jgi:hypothetical protein
MFRCEICGEVVAPGTPAVKRVVETRERQYPLRSVGADRSRKGNARRRRHAGDPGGQGREIVREQLVCPDCCEAAEAATSVEASRQSM